MRWKHMIDNTIMNQYEHLMDRKTNHHFRPRRMHRIDGIFKRKRG